MGQVQWIWTSGSFLPTIILNPSTGNTDDDVAQENEDPFASSSTLTTTDRPLPEEPLDPDVLRSFQCPFQQQQEEPPYCRYRVDCPFGHITKDSNTSLRPLPRCFCLERCLHQCECPNLRRISPEGLVQCDFGFHPELSDLIEPQQFARQVAQALAQRPVADWAALTGDGAQECVLCGQKIAIFWYPAREADTLCGLLENCTHRICGNCALQWRTNTKSSQFPCPVCRKASSRILLWPSGALYASPSYKAHLFETQKLGFGLQVAPQTSVQITEIPPVRPQNDPDQFEIQFQGIIWRGRFGPRNYAAPQV